MLARGAVFLVLASLAPVSCRRAEPDPAARTIVAVTVPPQAFLVERLAGDWVDVAIMMPPGTNPHTFEPTIKQVRTMGEAAVYVEVGHPKFPFEGSWIERLLSENEGVVVVDCSRGVRLDDEDPHVWTSPAALGTMTVHIAAALTAKLPARAADIERRRDDLVAEIERLSAEIRAALHGVAGRRFYVFHPAWGYFARDFDLEQVAIEQEGKEPDPGRLARVIERARRDGAKIVFAQPQLSRRSAELVAKEIGARVVTLDPLARDWLDNLHRVAAAIREGLV